MKKLNLFFLNFIRRFKKTRYMVNIVTMEIHDLGHESELCNLDKIKSYGLVDKKTMLELIDGGKYDGCHWCLQKYNSRAHYQKKAK